MSLESMQYILHGHLVTFIVLNTRIARIFHGNFNLILDPVHPYLDFTSLWQKLDPMVHGILQYRL